MSCDHWHSSNNFPTQTCSNIPEEKRIALVAARTICYELKECDEPTVVTKTFTESSMNFYEAAVTTDVNYLPGQYCLFLYTFFNPWIHC